MRKTVTNIRSSSPKETGTSKARAG
ncbi:MAG: hypothetical protein H6Q98_510, partial [Nitrospirae bacterium]|nr:hypothetical protein [Nitrospirota bacterium]